METVRSGFGDHIDIRTGIPAVSGIVARCLNFEFGDGIRIRNRKTANRYPFHAGVKAEPVVDNDAILQESVLSSTRAIHRDKGGALAYQAGILNGRVCS